MGVHVLRAKDAADHDRDADSRVRADAGAVDRGAAVWRNSVRPAGAGDGDSAGGLLGVFVGRAIRGNRFLPESSGVVRDRGGGVFRIVGHLGQVRVPGARLAGGVGAVRVPGGTGGVLCVGAGRVEGDARRARGVRVALDDSARRHFAGGGGLAVLQGAGASRGAGFGRFADAALFGGADVPVGGAVF